MDIWVRDINRYLSVPDPNGPHSSWSKATQRKFARFVATRYRSLVREVVLTQSMASSWKPLNEAYKEHKVRTGLNPGMWIATSKLIDSIVVYERTNYILVGVDRRKRHDGVPLYIIVQALEFGTGSIPPRPLFTPVYRKLVSSMPELFDEYLRKEGLR